MKRFATLLALLLVAALCLSACNFNSDGTKVANGGVLRLKVNPEIIVSYDADGNVTVIEAGNKDAVAIVESCTDYVGKPCKEVLSELVTAIGNAGYFTEELEGNGKKISIDIEAGSAIPAEGFVDEMTAKVLEVVQSYDWTAPIEVDFDDDDAPETENCIGGEKALEGVLADNGFTGDDISRIEAEFDGDDGVPTYDIEFVKDGVEYEYTVDAITGEILWTESEADLDFDDDDVPETEAHIGKDAATDKALADAGFARDEVFGLKAEFDGDDGAAVYEIEFVKNGVEYEYVINAITGAVIKAKTENEAFDGFDDDFDDDDDYDDGVCTNPNCTDYDCDDIDCDDNDYIGGVSQTDEYIGNERALEYALAHGGFAATEVSRVRVEFDYDDGIAVYELEFLRGGVEYEYTVDARTGKILEAEADD